MGDNDALHTLHEVLRIVTGVMAPFTPFITERVWQDLFANTEAVDSVHLSRWPTADPAVLEHRTSGNVLLLASDRALLLVGDPGTGKSWLAVGMAVKALQAKQVERIILTRPAVEAGERLGFLPGDLMAKVDPYLRPLYDALYEMVGSEGTQRLMEKGTIEVAPLAFMRGRTLDNAFVILDEAQNATESQLKMFLTRMGPSAKFIVTGDVTQIDLPRNQPSGLVQAIKILSNVQGIDFIYLDAQDVVRHRLVREIIEAYSKDR